MEQYAILRRKGFRSKEDVEAAGARSAAEGDKPGSGVRWIRSYVLGEHDGGLGSICIYEAEDTDAITAHARAADLPVDEVVPIAKTLVVRPDPVGAPG